MRHAVFNYLPQSAKTAHLVKELSYRPQATFLPQVPNHGTSKVLPQKPSRRYTELQQQGAAIGASKDLPQKPSKIYTKLQRYTKLQQNGAAIVRRDLEELEEPMRGRGEVVTRGKEKVS